MKFQTETAHRIVRFGRPVVLLLAAGWPGFGFSASTNMTSVADTTLSENYPSNNLGGLTFVNSGTTQNYTRNRGLFRFNIAGAIPAGSKIKSAALTLEVTHQPNAGYTFADFALHRLLQAWGEGNGTSPTNCLSCSGQGAPARTNEATWYYRFASTPDAWTAPGAAATNDYSPAVSSSQTIYGTDNSPYTFGSTAQMVADVQTWLDNPATNFGWILVCENEVDNFTARRFGSREDTNNAPLLQIQYLAPPHLDSPALSDNQFSFSFTALSDQPYTVEFRNDIATGLWQPLTNVGMPASTMEIRVSDTNSAARRFYRVVTY